MTWWRIGWPRLNIKYGNFHTARSQDGKSRDIRTTYIALMIAASASRPPIRLISRSFSSSNLKMRPLTVESLNPAILKVQYAVRGELAIKAESLRVQLHEKDHGLPFDKVISTNIGNPQQRGLDQPPITFTRQVSVCFNTYRQYLILPPQVAALMEWPALAELAPGVFPGDVIARAKELQEEIGSIGAYSHSQGIPFIRKNIAKFIEGERPSFAFLSFNVPTHSFVSTGWVSRESRPHFPYIWCLCRRRLAYLDAHLITQIWHSHPHSTISLVHCHASTIPRRPNSISS